MKSNPGKSSIDGEVIPEQSPEKEKNGCFTRRLFLGLGWLAVFSTLGAMVISTVRFFFPRVLFESSPIFKAGFPDDYPVGMVGTAYKDKYSILIIRGQDQIYALSTKCTHLGCEVLWRLFENRIYCPCHGSGFTREGVNYFGPAPRALERVKISLAPDGQLLIDKSQKFIYERGEWDKPEAYFQV